MRITLKPTGEPSKYGITATHPTVTIEFESDDIGLPDIYTELINPALTAWGFSQKTIEDFWSDGCLYVRDEKPESDLKKRELADKLERYNKWRRGDDSTELFSDYLPSEIGDWIDEAIAYLRGE